MSPVPEGALEELRAKASGAHQPRLFILSAPSGAGKDTVLDELRRGGLAIYVPVTCTTRPQRANEVDGVNYRFVSPSEFTGLRAGGELLESAIYAGHHYGVPKAPVREALAQGEDVVLKIEVQGAAAVKLMVPSAVLIFLAPPDVAELERRLRERGTENPEDLALRLAAAERELACIPGYDYLVVNHPGRLEETVNRVHNIILAERSRVSVRPVVL